MTPAQKERIRELFLAACEKNADERTEFLQRVCGGDESVRKEVESLLANDNEADTFLHTPALGKAFSQAQPESLLGQEASGHAADSTVNSGAGGSTEGMLPKRIGSYEILRELGRGGMGMVYLAQQDNPRRRVALKLIRPGAAVADMLGRFEREAQILGRLQHPGIAQVHDAGTTDTGAGPQPYFAMEFVEGIPATEYATTRNLSSRARLELMAKVCDAVQHAHQKGVIHRDLKPGNILVTQEGQPKILDFGVARATDSDVQATTLQTDIGQLIGTVSYMSPEQASGDPTDVDTRSDVYTLGVVLYELLVDRLPHNLRRTMIHEAVRMIREDEPARLSSINRTLRGDVDTIVAKAMHKDKVRRYQSASDLAGDIRRYLASEPILARPPTALYQLSKFTKRNKALVATATVALAALTLATIGMTLDRNRAVRAERLAEQRRLEAEEEATKAQAINAFMERTLSSVDPAKTLGRDVPFRGFLDLAAERVETELEGQPEVQAAVYSTLGRTYRQLGFLDDAELHLRRAFIDRQRLLGDEHPQTLDTMNNLALTLQDQDNMSEAEALYRQGLKTRKKVLGAEHPDTLLAINNLGWLLLKSDREEEAEKLFREALRLRRRVSGEDHLETRRTMLNLANVALRSGEPEEAERLSREVLEGCERTLGAEHPFTLYAMNVRIRVLRQLHRTDEALDLARRTLDGSRRMLGDEHPNTLHAMHNLAAALSDDGRSSEAESLHRETMKARRRVLGDHHPFTLASMDIVAGMLDARGEMIEAESLYTQVLKARRRSLGEEHPQTLSAMYKLALALQKQGKLEEAEPLASKYYERSDAAFEASHTHTQNALMLLVKLYEAWGKPGQAAEWQASLEESTQSVKLEEP